MKSIWSWHQNKNFYYNVRRLVFYFLQKTAHTRTVHTFDDWKELCSSFSFQQKTLISRGSPLKESSLGLPWLSKTLNNRNKRVKRLDIVWSWFSISFVFFSFVGVCSAKSVAFVSISKALIKIKEMVRFNSWCDGF